jgi:hypothetical protein
VLSCSCRRSEVGCLTERERHEALTGTMLRSGMLWIGIVLAVQGFGSFLTEKAWDTEFGVTALLPDSTPSWVSIAIGFLGLIIVGRTAARSRRSAHN